MHSAPKRLLALVVPANMLWVFLACTLACLSVGGGCTELEGVDCCAEAASVCTQVAAKDHCPIVAVERGVINLTDYRPRPELSVTLTAILPSADVDSNKASNPPSPLANAPPRARPLDRLPTLQI